MPYIIVKGSDSDPTKKNSLQFQSSNLSTENKKSSVDIKFINHTNYNYEPYNPRRPSNDVFDDSTVLLMTNNERENPAHHSIHSVIDVNAEINQQSREHLFVSVKGASRDMRDVLDFKVYKIKRRGLFDNHDSEGKKFLLGGDYYSGRKVMTVFRGTFKSQKKNEIVELNDNDLPGSSGKNAATILQNIRLIKNSASTSRRNGRAENREFLKTSISCEEKLKSIKCGQSIDAYTTFPSLNETLNWTFKDVDCSEKNLIQKMMDFSSALKHFENEMERERKIRLQQKARVNISDVKASALESSGAVDTSTISPESATDNNNIVAASMTLTTDPVMKSTSLPPSPRPPPSMSYGFDGVNGSKTVDYRFKFPGRSLQGQQNKPSSLAQQLDNVRVAGTETFLSNVVTAPTVPLREVSDSNAVVGSKPTCKHVNVNKKVQHSQNIVADAATVVSDSSSTPLIPFSPIMSPKVTVKRAPPSVPHRKYRHQQSALSISSEEKSNGTNGSGSINRTVERSKKQSVKYSNIVPSSGADQDRDAARTMKGNDHHHDLDIALDMLMKATERSEGLSLANTAALANSQKIGKRLLRQWVNFNAIEQEGKSESIRLVSLKGFERSVDMTQLVFCFMCKKQAKKEARGENKVIMPHMDRLYNGPTEIRTIAKEIKLMREASVKAKYATTMSRIFNHRWFITMVMKLSEQMKRMNNIIPMCCLKIVLVIRNIIELDYSLNEEVFYLIIEKTVVERDDHRKTIVHQVIRAVRDHVGILPEKFLEYLERKEIEPSPELLNQIRSKESPESKIRLRSAMEVRFHGFQSRETSPATRTTMLMNASRGGVLVEQEE